MPPITTKTLGPLHLEDLEPKRFEDLVRQLIYEFRPWRMLEATGRSGSDDGFDARGYEISEPQRNSAQEEEAETDALERGEQDRLWLVQCKREKEIGPKKLVGYLDAISEIERTELHGIIFATACDFSKRARDDFRERAREMGVAEAHLWGKAELEDMLFQPKNDHLLFANFGVSLQTRRRRLKTDVRARLAMKRKAQKFLDSHQSILLRDATDERYPWLAESAHLSRSDRGRWRVIQVVGCFHDGVRVLSQRHFAFLDDDGERWDFASWTNDAVLSKHEDPWSEKSREDTHLRSLAHDMWANLPTQNQAWYEVHAVLAYEQIIDIDELGDEWFQGPHIYAAASESGTPFRTGAYCNVYRVSRDSPSSPAVDEHRVEVFPREKPTIATEIDDAAMPVPDGDGWSYE